MTTNIQLLRSSVAAKRPAPATLLDGQAAVNTNALSPGLFFKLSNGTLTKIGPVEVNTSGVAPNTAPAGSTGNAQGETWFDGRAVFSSPVLKVYNGTQWLAASGFTVDDSDGSMSLTENLTVQNLLPTADGVGTIGSPSLRWANIYTNDLHLANDRGDWTVIEEEDYLSLRNNKTGKVFRLLMEEV